VTRPDKHQSRTAQTPNTSVCERANQIQTQALKSVRMRTRQRELIQRRLVRRKQNLNMHGRRLTLPDPVAMVHSRLEASPVAVTTLVMASNWPRRKDASPKFECRTCRAQCSVVMAMVVMGLCTRLQPARPSTEVRTADDARPVLWWQHVKRRFQYRVIHHWSAVLQV